jgi:DNA-binding transcriptional LysR family regulator
MALNLHALRVFVGVVDAGGFSRAAARLHVSQPAVSRAVIGLERETGVALLDRGARSVRLTDAGAALYDRAVELFAVERSAEEDLRARLALDRGVLHLGASTTIATYLLPPVLGAFRARHPGIRLHVTSANTRAVARALLRRRLDIALVEGPVDDARLVVTPWREDELILIAPPDHPLAQRRRVVPSAALVDAPFIARERGSGTRAVTEEALAGAGMRARPILTLDSTEAIKQAVAAGLGIAIISRAAASDQLALGRVRELRMAGLTIVRRLTRLHLVGRRPGAPAAAFNALLESRADGAVGATTADRTLRDARRR